MPTNIPPNNVTVAHGGLGYPSNQVYYVGGGGGGGGSNGTISASNFITSTLTLPPSGRMELKGSDADIVMNGVSLSDTLKLIQDRLNMLRPNTELEAEWDQLRDLGEQYRKLEKQLIEKQKAWDLLRKKEG